MYVTVSLCLNMRLCFYFQFFVLINNAEMTIFFLCFELFP